MIRPMVAHRCQIAIVDDDPAMRRAVGRLCVASQLPNRCFSSAEEFLASDAPEETSFLILDVHLPGLSGFELHESLTKRGIRLPVVFITGQDQPLSREKARKAGAAAYLTKPFAAADLIAAVRGQIRDESPSSKTT
ncbi:MAG: response regulator [Akkermansiaceae bacterium]|jgi:FixJ family two-component response regulator|nr:response regulator [Akkermansiaceae bacterium]